MKIWISGKIEDTQLNITITTGASSHFCHNKKSKQLAEELFFILSRYNMTTITIGARAQFSSTSSQFRHCASFLFSWCLIRGSCFLELGSIALSLIFFSSKRLRRHSLNSRNYAAESTELFWGLEIVIWRYSGLVRETARPTNTAGSLRQVHGSGRLMNGFAEWRPCNFAEERIASFIEVRTDHECSCANLAVCLLLHCGP